MAITIRGGHVLRSISPLSQDHVPSGKAVEKRKPSDLKTATHILDDGVISTRVPPNAPLLAFRQRIPTTISQVSEYGNLEKVVGKRESLVSIAQSVTADAPLA